MAENDTANQQPTDPANLPPATEVNTSGAAQQVVKDVDLDHPAVDDNPRGGRSLFVSRQGGAAEEVAEGVTDLDFEFLEAGGNAYTAAPTWNSVVAVRINMTLEGPDIDGQELVRTASNVVSMRSRTL